MADPRFFRREGPFPAAALAERVGATIADGADGGRLLADVAPLAGAGADAVSFLSGPKHHAALRDTRAGAVLLRAADAEHAPSTTICLFTDDPEGAYAQAASVFYPEPSVSAGVHDRACVHADARLAAGVAVGPGAVIGPRAEIGADTVIGANTVIGEACAIGRDCRIAANVTIAYALIGDRVRIHPGAAIGQDGYGYAPGASGHRKIPQLGRVIIQDDVEIGACTTVDRGAAGDTVIGEGSKIDNLVMVAHNCRIGRHCLVTGQVGLSGSTVLEDFVMLGGQVGCAGHLTVGAGSMVAAQSGVTGDLAPGGVYGGAPAKPIGQWRREVAYVSLMAKRRRGGRGKDKDEEQADDEDR